METQDHLDVVDYIENEELFEALCAAYEDDYEIMYTDDDYLPLPA